MNLPDGRISGCPPEAEVPRPEKTPRRADGAQYSRRAESGAGEGHSGE